MASFSPYTYRISEFDSYDGLSNQNTEAYYNVYTMLAKPTKRNVYKLSLGQLLHYMVDFGIGYNSVCSTTITTLQKFSTGMYVNKHETRSPLRPATVADLKEKVYDVVKKMIEVTIKGTSTTSNAGITKPNNVYPKYLFTLDTASDVADKLKLLTTHTYVEETNFTDFAYTSSTTFTPTYANGYAPADDFLMCPSHSHRTHDKMEKAIKYKVEVNLTTNGNIMWQGHANHTKLAQFQHYHYDKAVNPLWEPEFKSYGSVEANVQASWKKPDVECEDSEDKYPENTIKIGGKKYVSLRWPGRRYRLFKRTD